MGEISFQIGLLSVPAERRSSGRTSRHRAPVAKKDPVFASTRRVLAEYSLALRKLDHVMDDFLDFKAFVCTHETGGAFLMVVHTSSAQTSTTVDI
jgi:hypothetical protein